jgi:hypothetical protein
MFDLFGDSVPVPLAHISLPEIETPAVTKHQWEKELLGVAFSGGNPLQELALVSDTETIVFASQIGVDMVGKKIVLAGQVSGAIQRQTRDQRPFTIATLALLDGAVEVFVWEDRLAQTQGLWEEGTLVTVVGSVKARGDRVSVTCLSAERYVVPEGEGGGEGREGADASPRETAPAAVVSPSIPSPVVESNGGVPARTPRDGVRPQTPSEKPRRLTLRIRETDRPTDDHQVLESLSRVLLEYRGDDNVSLEIATNGRLVTLEWPLVNVNICPPLEQGLRDVLGSGGQVLVE